MKFNDTFFSRADRYSLGVESTSGRHYLSIPVSNRLVDYAECYALKPEQYDAFMNDRSAAIRFAE